MFRCLSVVGQVRHASRRSTTAACIDLTVDGSFCLQPSLIRLPRRRITLEEALSSYNDVQQRLEKAKKEGEAVIPSEVLP